MQLNRHQDLPDLIQTYALNLVEQAGILRELPGSLAAENHAEATAYLVVANDLHRILADELGIAGIRPDPVWGVTAELA